MIKTTKCIIEKLEKEVNLHNYPPKNYVGDGKLPNLYYVTADSGYYYLLQYAGESTLIDCTEVKKHECVLKYKEVGVFKKFKDALRIAEHIFDDGDFERVYIEDRLSGEIYELFRYYTVTEVKTFDVKNNTVGDTAFAIYDEYEVDMVDSTQFTKEQLETCGFEFE